MSSISVNLSIPLCVGSGVMDWFCHFCSVHSVLTWKGAGRLWGKVIAVPGLTLTYSLLGISCTFLTGKHRVSFWLLDAQLKDHTLAGPVLNLRSPFWSDNRPIDSASGGRAGSVLRQGKQRWGAWAPGETQTPSHYGPMQSCVSSGVTCPNCNWLFPASLSTILMEYYWPAQNMWPWTSKPST